jgi:uncharacterized protein (DUF1330 family)
MIMNCYFIAQIRINDEKEYRNYLEKAGEIFKKYNGKYLSVDNNPLILEGRWDYTRTVLIKFERIEDFNDWYKSDDYQRILKHRLKAAVCDSILIKGLN